MSITSRFPSEAIKEIAQLCRKGRLREGNLRCPRFVIQEHYASHLHWDFRLEMNGVLKSWAIPKTPPRIKNIKRLAIQVEDHSLNYADFEGEIPKGQYGAGKVKIWDKGTYNLIKKDKEKIEFELFGKKLKGKYILINAKLQGNKKNWLFMKI
ncbi:MAG: 3'-phosphoesterase [Nanoarchaeota archaeon]|nr:3'-phosphoesterase [Nanoarchaeota archaeon]MBU4116875.1 3'-phosphoesterase [Nanoarchaeota archaeon]